MLKVTLLVVAVAVLTLVTRAVVLGVLERTVPPAIRERVTGLLSEALQTDRVELELPEGPLVPHLRRRRIPWARLVAEDVPIKDGAATLRRLEIDLEAVDLPRTPTSGEVRAGRARFRAHIAPDELKTIAELPSLVRHVRIVRGGVRLFTMAGAWLTVGLDADEGALVLKPQGGSLASLTGLKARIPIRSLPAGAIIEVIETRDDELIVSGPLDGDRLVSRSGDGDNGRGDASGAAPDADDAPTTPSEEDG